MNPIHHYLKETHLKDVVSEGIDVCTISESATIEDAVKLLGSKGFLSAPVVDKEKKCIGLIDMMDIVSVIVSVAPTQEEFLKNPQNSLEMAGRAMALKNVSEVLNASGSDPFVPVYIDEPLSRAAETFARGVHRSPILNRQDQPIHDISQSTINRLVSDKMEFSGFKVLGAKTVESYGIGVSQPISIKVGSFVLEAFKLLSNSRVSAIAVVDENGKLVGNFSASDLKGLYTEFLPSLFLPIEAYLQKHSPKSLTPITISKDETLAAVVKKLSEAKFHRMWVADKSGIPTGVVSLTDLMKVFVSDDFKV